LQKDGEPLEIGSRAIDVLIALVEAAGEVVGQAELMTKAWPNVIVGEGSLRVTIAGLRKALGDGQDGARYITNVTGRGYCFVAPVERLAAAFGPASAEPARTFDQPHQNEPILPVRVAHMVGREEVVETLCMRLISRRFVSIVGPGGMGKTTVAVAVAHALLDEFGDAVFFVDLGALTDGSLVASAVAAALGMFGQKADPLPGLLAFLAHRRILLILDSCEHLIAATVALTEELHRAAPRVHILTTTREALRAQGEHIHLLQPLDCPPAHENLTAAEALESPAVQLFVDRAYASGHGAPLSDADASTVAGICTRLDGIALAIEVAASRVGSYGLRQTADLLDNRFKLLWQGRRSAPPRHQTLAALLDWSFNLLSDRDRRVFRRLSIFVGVFTHEAAEAVAVDEDLGADEVREAITSLIDKSMIWVVAVGHATQYRLLDPAQAYAEEKLAQSGETNAIARRHAHHIAERLARGLRQDVAISSDEVAAAALNLGNIRAALEWSFSDAGDRSVGLELAAAAAPFFFDLSLLVECVRWCEQGLAALPNQDDQSATRLALQATLAASAMFTRGNSEEVRRAIEDGLALADALGHPRYQTHLLIGLGIFLSRVGDFQGALEVAKRGYAITGRIGTPEVVSAGESILGVALHLVGDQIGTQRHCERALEATRARSAAVVYFGYDHEIRALIALARCYWLRGYPDKAAVTARRVVDLATKRGQPVNHCMTLIYAATVFLWRGDLDEAERLVGRLIGQSLRHSLSPYHSVGMALSGELKIARGKPEEGVTLLKAALGQLEDERHHALTPALHVTLGDGLLKAGQPSEARLVVDAGLSLSERFGETLNVPELLRVRGEIWLSEAAPNHAAAEVAFEQSMALARSQGAVSLELRTAMPLAQLWSDLGRGPEAVELLRGIYGRFNEGIETSDLEAAALMLNTLGGGDGRCGSLERG